MGTGLTEQFPDPLGITGMEECSFPNDVCSLLTLFFQFGQPWVCLVTVNSDCSDLVLGQGWLYPTVCEMTWVLAPHTSSCDFHFFPSFCSVCSCLGLVSVLACVHQPAPVSYPDSCPRRPK